MQEWPGNQKSILAKDRDPERPWWRKASYLWIRDDGCVVNNNEYGQDEYNLGKPEFLVSGIQHDTTKEIFDKVKPLPHPGFRPGQVWLLDWGQLSIIGLLSFNTPIKVLRGEPFYSEIDKDSRMSFNGSPLTRNDVDYLFFQILGYTDPFVFGQYVEKAQPPLAFLVSDPVCPWLAPWGPVKIK